MRRCAHKQREMHHIEWKGETFLLCYECCMTITDRITARAKKIMETEL